MDSPNESKPLREIKQMLNLEKDSFKANSENISSPTFTPTSNVRNGFRRKKGDSPFTYNLNLKVKKEKKQFNFTNPDPWAKIVGSRNTAAIYMNGVATTALFDTGAEIQLVNKQFCEDNEWEIQPIEKLTECSTVNGEIFGYEGFVEVNGIMSSLMLQYSIMKHSKKTTKWEVMTCKNGIISINKGYQETM